MCSRIDMHDADSRCSASRPIPIAKVKTLTRGLGSKFDLFTFWPQGHYMPRSCHELYFGADSSSRFHLRARTNRQTQLTPYPRRRLYSRRG